MAMGKATKVAPSGRRPSCRSRDRPAALNRGPPDAAKKGHGAALKDRRPNETFTVNLFYFTLRSPHNKPASTTVIRLILTVFNRLGLFSRYAKLTLCAIL